MNKFRAVLFLISDLLTLLVVFSLTSATLMLTGHELPMNVMDKGLYAFYSSVLLIMIYIEGLYTLETFDPSTMPVSLVRASALSLSLCILVLGTLYLTDSKFDAPMFLIINSLSLPYLIYLARTKVLSYLSMEVYARDTVLIGSQDTVELTFKEVSKRPFLGYRIKEQFSNEEWGTLSLPGKIKVIALERHLMNNPLIQEKLLEQKDIELMDLAQFAEHVSGKIPLACVDDEWINTYCHRAPSKLYSFSKMLLDKSAAILLLLILAPFSLILFPILLIFHGRPIFFKQTRTGLNNRPFTLYKLRTMVTDAEKNGEAVWCRPGDSRITPLGKWLRKTRIDELPQLYNILRGDMGLVGPRPERPEIIQRELRIKVPHFELRHSVRPGVTGHAQVSFRYGFSMEDAKEKLQYDLYYVKNRDLWLDLTIIMKTIKTVLTGAGQ